ncbi:MAG: LamG domain-containing protein, partial [Candidatus Jacksonbacteria bacterium]|nr:LamG domain-containing protein [Candidatus Jacksonbacteria bacterium]
MRKISHHIEHNNIFAIILVIAVLVGGYFIFTLSPQNSATLRHTYEPNNDIVRVADDDPSNALYINNNPKFEVLLGDKENPNKPTVTYISHISNIPHSLTFTLADSNENATAPSLETVVSGEGDKKPRLIYRSALDNADINYRIDKGRGVKEEIILKVAPADNGGRDVGFVFDAEFSEGVQVEQAKDGVWYFTDSGGNYLFNFERPFMVDADGVRSNDVVIDIVPVESVERCDLEEELCDGKRSFLAEPSNKSYQIILKANGPWLFDEERAYPVMIDPSVTHNADSDFTGQFNRVVDADTTSSTQLEIGYQEHGLDPYTVLLLHGNEATGSTVITDTASSTRVITASGNASTTNATTQPGLNNSMAFDGTGDYFSLPDSDEWDVPSGDFTISMFFKPANLTSDMSLIMHGNAGTENYWRIRYDFDAGFRYEMITSGIYTVNMTGAGILSDTNWHHVVLNKVGNEYGMYIDGAIVQSVSDADLSAFTGDLIIGRLSAASQELNGFLDEIRIIKGRSLTIEEIKAAAKR